MKIKTYFTVVVLMFVFLFSVMGLETIEYVPDSNICLVTISNMSGDKGLTWLIDAYLNSPRKSGLREIARSAKFQDLAVALFPPRKDFAIYAVIVLKTAKGAKVEQDQLNKVILTDEGAVLKNLTHKGKTINYTEVTAKVDFSAYCVLDDVLLFGSDADVIKKVLDEASVVKTVNYKALLANTAKAQDGVFFAENGNAGFANFLKPLEKKWKMNLLLGVDNLEWMGASFDVIDSNKVSGMIIFQGKGKTDDLKDDAEFLGEAFKRKFIADKINYTGEVKVKDKTVTLQIQVEGLEALWKKLFAEGVFSIFIK